MIYYFFTGPPKLSRIVIGDRSWDSDIVLPAIFPIFHFWTPSSSSLKSRPQKGNGRSRTNHSWKSLKRKADKSTHLLYLQQSSRSVLEECDSFPTLQLVRRLLPHEICLRCQTLWEKGKKMKIKSPYKLLSRNFHCSNIFGGCFESVFGTKKSALKAPNCKPQTSGKATVHTRHPPGLCNLMTSLRLLVDRGTTGQVQCVLRDQGTRFGLMEALYHWSYSILKWMPHPTKISLGCFFQMIATAIASGKTSPKWFEVKVTGLSTHPPPAASWGTSQSRSDAKSSRDLQRSIQNISKLMHPQVVAPFFPKNNTEPGNLLGFKLFQSQKQCLAERPKHCRTSFLVL